MQWVFIAVFLAIVLAILGLFLYKAGKQLQYLRIRKKKKPGAVKDFWSFDFSDPKARQMRIEAFLLFPLLFAIAIDEDKQELNDIKQEVKRIHILIYLLIIVLIIMAILSEKVF